MWSKRNLIIFLGIIILLAITASVKFIFIQQGIEEIPVAIEEKTPDRQFKDIKLTVFGDNKEVNWVINSEIINSYNQEGYLELAPIQIKALNPENQRKLYFISATAATYYTASGIMEMEGPVHLERDEEKLQADFFSLESTANCFTGQGNVRFHSPTLQITSQEFEANLDLGRISFRGSKEQQAYLTWE